MKPNHISTEYDQPCFTDNHIKSCIFISGRSPTALARPTSLQNPHHHTQIHSHLALLVPFVWFPAYVETLSRETVKRKVLIMFWTLESMQAQILLDTDICGWYSSFTLLSPKKKKKPQLKLHILACTNDSLHTESTGKQPQWEEKYLIFNI